MKSSHGKGEGFVSVVRRLLRPFPGSQRYWEDRYARGGDSGAGSRGSCATFKAQFLNRFVREKGIESVIEFGCGDGNQVELSEYPRYLGFDVSRSSVDSCRRRFGGDKTKRFALLDEYAGERADLVLSLDVIYHLVEDDVFEEHMERLFDASDRSVIIYSSRAERKALLPGSHVRHRDFTAWISSRRPPGWELSRHVPGPAPLGFPGTGKRADFFIYERPGRDVPPPDGGQ